MKSSVPRDNFTPYGYIDNLYHSWKLNPSGLIKTNPPVGMAWHIPNVRSALRVCTLNLGLVSVQKRLLTNADFENANVPVECTYHTKNVLMYGVTAWGLRVTCEFFLEEENLLSCACRISTVGKRARRAGLVAAVALRMGKDRRPHRGSGLTAVSRSDLNALILRVFGEGPVFGLAGSRPAQGCVLRGSPEELSASDLMATSRALANDSASGDNHVAGWLTFAIPVGTRGSKEIKLRLAKGFSEKSLEKVLQRKALLVNTALRVKRRVDEEFWDGCPQLVGDWPAHWRRGWVYDWETLRMCVRPPVGVYQTHWDAMQIQNPRVVLAETALDMMMMSHADVDLAKEVLLGTFSDALGPHVPCSREDGSVNMVAADGCECGTSPAWCFPFHCIESTYERYGDTQWLASIVPHMESYLSWWLDHRVDSEGWAVYKCSWESGQDCSEKFRVEQPTGAELVEHIRAVDLQAAICGSAGTLVRLLRLLGRPVRRWERVRDSFAAKVQEMWQTNWFCDFDRRTKQWVKPGGYYDITNLAPLLFGLGSETQVRTLLPRIRWFLENPRYWLEWASFFFMYAELLWGIGQLELLAGAVHKTADRVYRMWDRQEWDCESAMPGVSVECWGLDGAIGSEGYGWAATLPLHIIRGILGYREARGKDDCFYLSPSIPKALAEKADVLGISNLKYRDIRFDLSYQIQQGHELLVRMQAIGREVRSLTVQQEDVSLFLAESSRTSDTHKLEFVAENFKIYEVRIHRD